MFEGELIGTLGALAFNLVSRDADTAAEVKATVKRVFPAVFSITSDEDVNEVIICPLHPESGEPLKGAKVGWAQDYRESVGKLVAL